MWIWSSKRVPKRWDVPSSGWTRRGTTWTTVATLGLSNEWENAKERVGGRSGQDDAS